MTETESTICLVFCDACVAAHAILNFSQFHHLAGRFYKHFTRQLRRLQ